MVNNTNNTADETILSKITKLLAKAEGTSNPHEAEVFTAKAMELMMKWSVDEAVLAAHRGAVNRNEIIAVVIPFYGVYHQAHSRLAHGIGIAFGFRRVSIGAGDGAKNRMTWIGFENDIASAQLIYTSLLVQLEVALCDFVKTNTAVFSYSTASEKYQLRRSFMIGFGDVAAARLSESRQTVVDTTPGAGLVLVSRQSDIDATTHALFPDLRPARSRSLRVKSRGYAQGTDAGARANLGGTTVGGGVRGALTR